ncbi:hypothetical protein FEM48_Zijuj08G0065200 [Ziziphus jujuba var. spinosa]|uniref:Uncharacterized protein n=1 Tax=Ziziphus jujuba var. spinosa TaxID=714518 RepID=A0A978UXI5_ZIZJJ|nr:hypothetical protein FEM48_Zijuj08G0065200 [Ziziphus jujuba var. spinosa]
MEEDLYPDQPCLHPSFLFDLHGKSTSFYCCFLNETQQSEAIFKEPYFNIFSSESALFWLFQLPCFVSVFIFCLLSTSACFYTVACIHTDREVTFKKVAAVVPRVLKRLIFTSLCTFIAFIPYIIGAVLIIIASVIFIAVVISTDSLVVTVSGCAVIALILLVYLADKYVLGEYVPLKTSEEFQLENLVMFEDPRGTSACEI